MNKIRLFFFATLLSVRGICQNLDFYGLFPVLSNTQVINTKFDLNFLAASKISGITRTIDGVTYPAKDLEIYLQTQFSFKPSDRLSFSFIYGFQRNNPFDQNYTNEHRWAQQFLYSLPIKRKVAYQRFRFEERFIQSTDAQYVMATRLRYQFGVMMPLGEKTYFNIANELFLITSKPRTSFLAENMLYLGVGERMGKSSTVEIGLVHNPTVRNASGDIRNLFLLQLLWSSSVHWRERQVGLMQHIRHY